MSPLEKNSPYRKFEKTFSLKYEIAAALLVLAGLATLFSCQLTGKIKLSKTNFTRLTATGSSMLLLLLVIGILKRSMLHFLKKYASKKKAELFTKRTELIAENGEALSKILLIYADSAKQDDEYERALTKLLGKRISRKYRSVLEEERALILESNQALSALIQDYMRLKELNDRHEKEWNDQHLIEEENETYARIEVNIARLKELDQERFQIPIVKKKGSQSHQS